MKTELYAGPADGKKLKIEPVPPRLFVQDIDDPDLFHIYDYMGAGWYNYSHCERCKGGHDGPEGN